MRKSHFLLTLCLTSIASTAVEAMEAALDQYERTFETDHPVYDGA